MRLQTHCHNSTFFEDCQYPFGLIKPNLKTKRNPLGFLIIIKNFLSIWIRADVFPRFFDSFSKDRSKAAPNFQNFEFSRGFHCDLRSQNKFELFSKYSISAEFAMGFWSPPHPRRPNHKEFWLKN